MIQLDPPIPLECPKGTWKGFAYFVADYSMDHDLVWTIFQDDGEIWSRQNRDVRAVNNITFKRNRDQNDN